MIKCYYCKNKFKRENVYLYSKARNEFVCRECNTKRCKEYRNTKGGKKSISEAVAKYNKKNKDKTSCWSKIKWGKKKGIVKEQVCCVCGEKAVAHHPDYSKPLEVIWLCHKHHKEIHSK